MSAVAPMPILAATLVWGARGWLVPSLVIVAIATTAIVWSYRQARGPIWLRLTAGGLKGLGLGLLAIALVDPLWSSRRARPGENLVLMVVDNSHSMQVHTRDRGASPAEEFAARLADDRQPWLVRLRQDFDVRGYTFDRRLEPCNKFAEVGFDGTASRLHATLGSLGERYAGRPVAGIVLFSDGAATDARRAIDFGHLPPVYPVLPASAEPAPDVSLASIAATQTNFEDAPVTLVAETLSRLVHEPLTAELLDQAGKVVDTQEYSPATEEAVAFRFQFRPEQPGLSFYRVRVAPTSQLGAWSKPALSREATLANNQRWVAIDRGHGPLRILYVGGMPNPEHKFLGRALAEDAQIELVSLVRIARREPKFDFRSRAGESTNPLFRGFDRTDDDSQRYDQPVFVRLGIDDESELRDGFPKTAEQLFAYHAVLLDDVEASMFTTDQMALIGRFVSERGGGLMMLGGRDSFEKGEFAKTLLADVLPVYLQRPASGDAPPASGYRWQLTRDGWLEPWMRLRSTEADERQRLDAMPPLRTLNHVAGVKPGASTLAVAVDSSGHEQPALVVHAYGRGRAAALAVGDLWRWRLKQDPEQHDLEKMWRQTIRWLTGDVPGRVSVDCQAVDNDSTHSVRIAIEARDAEFQPLDNAQVTIDVTPPDGPLRTLDAEPSRSRPGVYEASYVPRGAGPYRSVARVVDGSGAALDPIESGWTHDPAADEFRSLAVDRNALTVLAEQTGGETVELADLDRFAANLAARPAPESIETLFPVWHTGWVFAVAIACLAGEWGLRRWRGLP
ncbi:MAG TPA: hypothetical protein VG713_14160 [Pirellulales bacterium]|nr:hypothetical protein [Pirellulales bacterium]